MSAKFSEQIIRVLSGLSRAEASRCFDMAARLERMGMPQDKIDAAVETFVESGVYLRGVR